MGVFLRMVVCLCGVQTLQSLRHRYLKTQEGCEQAVSGSERNTNWIKRGNDCRCPEGTFIQGPNSYCVGKTGWDTYFNSTKLGGRSCRCDKKEIMDGMAGDGNPWGWDRYRRCDDDYSPTCKMCEGIGGIVDADERTSVELPFCEPVLSKDDVDPSTLISPVWGDDFTVETSHEILIGPKTDAACFQAFPSNDSVAPMCYKPQDVKISSDMVTARALRLDVVQGGNAWGLVGNVSSLIFHQYGNMWITNTLPLGITQTICTSPREGGDKSKPPVAPLQFNWTKNLAFMGRERIDVEYGIGRQTLDHWIFGPHHAWTNPETGLIVRMWQPFNGLQVFEPGAYSTGTDSSLFSDLRPDGSKPPAAAMPGGSTFRIKCGENGFSEDSASTESQSVSERVGQVGLDQSSSRDLERAREKVPRAAYKGDSFSSMADTLNRWLLVHAPNSKNCDAWTVDELQKLQVQLFALRDPQLNGVYRESWDNRRLRSELLELRSEWEDLNTLARESPTLMRIHRDGHCHEAVMWYVHHLPEVIKSGLKDNIALPLLSRMKHEASKTPDANVSFAATQIHKAYRNKVSCADCHSAVFPGQ